MEPEKILYFGGAPPTPAQQLANELIHKEWEKHTVIPSYRLPVHRHRYTLQSSRNSTGIVREIWKCKCGKKL